MQLLLADVWIGPEKLGPLRIDVAAAVLGLVAFACVSLVLAKVLLPRINAVLQARYEATEGRLEQAEALQAEADAVRADYLARLADARHDANRIRQAAAEEGMADLLRDREEGRRTADDLVARGREELARSRARAEEELRPYVRELAVEIAERVLGEPLDPGRGRG
ncbi:hypothetical protein AB0M28_08750 [Streptomyces sp. NPDC051940]|uniref:F0F1 ATP synthase subunit B family protein n=1 Tax=Streptomyces sp. NPDC051940 TaxID=3155675 RepID=UPI00341F5234